MRSSAACFHPTFQQVRFCFSCPRMGHAFRWRSLHKSPSFLKEPRPQSSTGRGGGCSGSCVLTATHLAISISSAGSLWGGDSPSSLGVGGHRGQDQAGPPPLCEDRLMGYMSHRPARDPGWKSQGVCSVSDAAAAAALRNSPPTPAPSLTDSVVTQRIGNNRFLRPSPASPLSDPKRSS